MPRAKLQVARARATKRHCMIILFDAIIASPDLAATPLHAIRGDFSPSFFLFFLFFFFWFAGGHGTIDSRETRLFIFRRNRIVMLKESDLRIFLFLYFFHFFFFRSLSRRSVYIKRFRPRWCLKYPFIREVGSGGIRARNTICKLIYKRANNSPRRESRRFGEE